MASEGTPNYLQGFKSMDTQKRSFMGLPFPCEGPPWHFAILQLKPKRDLETYAREAQLHLNPLQKVPSQN